MRVLLAHKFDAVAGGAEVFFHETARILRERGHSVHSFATGEPSASTEDITLVRAPAYDSPSLAQRLRAAPKVIYNRAAKAAFGAVIDRFAPDLVHAFHVHVHLSPSILAAARERGLPVVLTCNDYKHICPNYKLFHHGRICMDCERGVFLNAVRNRCCHESLLVSAMSAAEAYIHDRLGVYRDMVDTYTFSSAFMDEVTARFWRDRVPFRSRRLLNPFDSRKFAAEPDYEDYALFFGRFADEKGVDAILDAAARIDGFPVRIVGAGPLEAHLTARAAREGLDNVTFLGPRWGEALDAVLRPAGMVLVPSVWHENFPYVINQSFAYGRPVIGSARGGIPELVAHERRGLVYDPEDPDALAACIRRLARDPALRRSLGTEAKRYSDETFNDDAFYAQLQAIYGETLDAHSRRGR